MFKQSEIGVKCTCDVPETVVREHGFKRYLVPKGYYGGLYQRAGYYVAEWWTLRCDQCGREREDFYVWKWGGNGDMWPIDGSIVEGRTSKYADVKRAIVERMAK